MLAPTSSTLDQHCTNVIQMFCVYWDVTWCCSAQQRAASVYSSLREAVLNNAELKGKCMFLSADAVTSHGSTFVLELEG